MTTIADDPQADAELDKLGNELLTQSQNHELGAQVEPDAAPPVEAEAEVTSEVVPSEETKPDNSEAEPVQELSKPPRKRDAQGRFLKEDGEIDEDQTEQPTDKPVSEYEQKKLEKANKDRERLDRSWQRLDVEKEEVRKTSEQLRQQQAQLQQMWQQQQLQNQRPQGQRYNSQDLQDASREFMDRAAKAWKEGDVEAGDNNYKLAQQSFTHAQQLHVQETQTRQQYEMANFQQAYSANMDQAAKADPDILNPESPLAKELHAILNDPKVGDIIGSFDEGFPYAVQVAKWKLEAASASELKDKLNKAETELSKLRKATTPLGATPAGQPSAGKSIDQMSDKEIDRELEKLERKAWREEALA